MIHTDKDRESYAVVRGSKVSTTEEGTYQVLNDQKIYTTNDGATYTVDKDGKKVFAVDAASIEKKVFSLLILESLRFKE